MTLTAVSFQTVAAQQPLRWPPVIPSTGCDARAFDFQWRRTQFLFPDVHDPRTFPAFAPGTVPPNAVDALRRFQVQAVHLAESRVVNEGASMNTRFPDGGSGEPEVEYTFPAQDAIAGFSVLFRQCYSPDEKASFAKVQGVLRQAMKAREDGHQAERTSQLNAWARAQGQLRAYDLLTLCGRALSAKRTDGGFINDGQRESPEFIISAFNYGADIHWGDKRDTVAVWNSDGFLGPHQRMRFFESAVSLAYVYLGVSELIEAALGADG